MNAFLFISIHIIYGVAFLTFLYTKINKESRLNQYKNNKNNVIFTELVRYETESVMLRTDINIRMLIPHIELDKHYTKLDK